MEFGTAQTVLLVVFGALTLGAGISVIMQRNPLGSAVSLLFAFVGLSGLYILLNAQIIALFQVMVYAGAILILIVYVIMLLNLKDEGRPGLYIIKGGQRIAGMLAGVALLAEVLYILTSLSPRTRVVAAETFGDPKSLAELLFSRYVFAFEIASVLLLVAIVGAVILSRKSKGEPFVHDETETGQESEEKADES